MSQRAHSCRRLAASWGASAVAVALSLAAGGVHAQFAQQGNWAHPETPGQVGDSLGGDAFAGEAPDSERRPVIVVPARLPAACIKSAAQDYRVPATVLLAMIKVESKGRSVVGRNPGGSIDIGVSQINSRSWAPYLRDRYGIEPQDLLEPCQSIRAQAYVLRKELDHKECAGVDLWCGVGRYHSPGNKAARAVYVPKVQMALASMLQTGRFE